jgi:hypothetical protein
MSRDGDAFAGAALESLAPSRLAVNGVPAASRDGASDSKARPTVATVDPWVRMRRHVGCSTLSVGLAFAGGCARPTPVNPSFPLSSDAATAALRDDAERPVHLARPVVVIGGFLDPGVAAAVLAADVRRATGDDRVTGVELGTFLTLDGCRRHVIDAVDVAFPTTDPTATTEVDVVGYSLGGVVARDAANPAAPGDRRLRIARLFTISSPLRGATAATLLSADLHPIQGPMRPGSPFLARLNDPAVAGRYPICSYVCLGDDAVGARNASLPGVPPWWVSGPMVGSPHDWAFLDDRIVADVVARLRGDRPFTTSPPAPLPDDEP